MGLASFIASFATVYADSEEKPVETKEEEQPVETKEEEPAENAKEEEQEEEEPEDEQPKIREECKESAKCAALTKHFEHCQEKVQAGKGFKGEDCVEELMMHCVDECAAPKLFGKLK